MNTSIFGTLVLFCLLVSSSLSWAGVNFKETLNIGEGRSPGVYRYSGIALTKGIAIKVKLHSRTKSGEGGDALFSCDAPVTLKLRGKKYRGQKIQAILEKGNKSKLSMTLFLESDTTICDVKVSLKGLETQNFHIAPFNELLPQFEMPEDGTEEGAVLLDSGVKAIQKRLQILTGRDFTDDEILERDPQIPLDISKAPKYDFILFSTLQFNNDFITNVMFRALALHAQRGTPVLIIGNNLMVGKKEQALVDWTLAQSPNIKFLPYTYARETGKLKDRINQLHRVSHIKVFLTYSKDHPERNHIVSGGRNNSDRYFFPEFKPLIGDQYTHFDKELLNKWAFFNDLEFYLRSPSDVIAIIRQMLNFSMIQKSSDFTEIQPGNFNFFVSVPYEDNKALEDKYVELINRAQKTIRIFTPYIYLTPRIKEALQAANDREVNVIIVTSQYLIGDAMTAALKRAYDRFVYDNNKYINVFHYVADKVVVLHKKAMLIDEDTLVLGSINLSQRSFIHDTEMAVTIENKQMISDFLEVFHQYKAQSMPFDEKKKESFIRNFARLIKAEHFF